MARAKVIELHSREIIPISKGKRKNVYTNGEDDNYPERIDLLINNSVTAKMAANKMASFIIGQGFEDKDLNNKVVNKKKGYTAYDILTMIANSITRHKGSWIYVNYNGLYKPDTLDVLPYRNCRKEKEDDVDNEGKIYYSTKWGEAGFSFNKKSDKSKWFYPFSNKEEVVKAQFKADNVQFNADSPKNNNNFRGQVLFINLEPENIYPLAFIDAAYHDADSEYHSSVHRNNNIKNGFTDKQIIVAREGTDEEEDSQFEKAIINMLGTDGSNVALINVDRTVESLSQEVYVEKLGGDVKPERYKYYDEVNESKILHCFENIPKALVLGNDTSLLGDGGKKLMELKLNYSEDVSYIRMKIEQGLKKIYPEENWKITPLITKEEVYGSV